MEAVINHRRRRVYIAWSRINLFAILMYSLGLHKIIYVHKKRRADLRSNRYKTEEPLSLLPFPFYQKGKRKKKRKKKVVHSSYVRINSSPS